VIEQHSGDIRDALEEVSGQVVERVQVILLDEVGSDG